MIFFLALIPATMLSIAGLVALYLSARSEGAVRTVGRYLGFWAFTLAVLVVLASVVVAARAPHMRAMAQRFHPMAGPMGPALRGAPPLNVTGAPPNLEQPPAERAAPGPAPAPQK